MRSSIVDPAAVAEAADARAWYARRSPTAASLFEADLELALHRIAEHPERWARFGRDARRYVMHHFPFVVVYVVRGDVVKVMAVASTSRKPGYWVGRLMRD